MRRLLFAAAALLLNVESAAQTHVCEGFGSTTGPAILKDGALTLTCMPAWAGGVGQGFGQALTIDGAVAWVYCPAPVSSPTGWQLLIGVRTWSEIIAQTPAFTAALLQPNKIAAVEAAASAAGYGDFASPELKKIWCPSYAAILASKPTGFPPGYVPPPPPPPPPWTVAKNSTFPDRPAFRVTAGVRSLSSSARAAVGSACDDVITLVEGRSTYKKVSTTTAQTGDFVAICTQSTP